MPEHYDAVVVGAGPAGAATALTLARNGISVCLLERGQYPGAKNIFGGTIYRQPTELLVPAFWEEAPLERPVVKDELWLMEEDSAINVGFTGLKFGRAPYNKFCVHRSQFDRWLADQAVRAGARLYCNTTARDLVLKGKQVIGVEVDGGERILADVTVLAEGVMAMLTRKAGLRSQIPPHAVTLYVREVLALPAEKIEDRFNLPAGLGATIGLLGWPTGGAIGKAGIWTMKDTVAIIVGGFLDDLIKKGLSPRWLLDRFKQHPIMKKLLAGAEPIEYQAHLIPKGGYKGIPKLYRDGLLVAGDAAVMISGRRGSDLAMLTGKYAAETIIQAKARGDFTAKMLGAYARKLNDTFFMKDIKAGKDALSYYEHYSDSDFLISRLANQSAYEFFTEGLITEKEKKERIVRMFVNYQKLGKTVKDLYAGIKNWGVF
ncbi:MULTISPECIES: FAD-dependent oxidoreductase [Carboxydocella]|uniref:Electron transfer flavoprotein-quinone oxidoreductase n=2 Tax=Carboxydocella TaxID=178898 RepID=A0A1T4Q6D5_9FIRM|nr:MULTISPECIES: FAD-dependent oxidoreductase [Carboxydocella]AVX21177.1 electron transfer flavoprotein-quinone oxidoreductase [Carboxydocella thermautotrophica]AVX31612.1 electron transfer flavoprotein-quinone oxidoreductase [Carboxydocella thermautotrophica]SJZ99127.1 electron transfer flavoprotein-quinone oxidoreductase [Carboxydocella sporoproducens DSM 16521]GAW27821.1 FAD-dependent oxidoreductase [Carboxydocella sp. ULO1]GAW30270.1 FAD-dependent oxidoreductase [Carboxydocella sp. JDF658]